MLSFRASDGLELAYRIDDFTKPWRESERLLILHSAMSCSQRFFSWMPRLCARYRVARLDLRGHGQSALPAPDRPLTLRRLVDDVREFMDEIGWRKAHIVGASAGGYLAQRLAIDHPERVESLALYASTPGLKRSQAPSWVPIIREKGLRGFLSETIHDRFPVGECDPELIEWFLDQTSSNDPDYVIAFVSLMAGQDWPDELHKIRCPTLVVIPGLSRIGEIEAYDPMRANIADVDVITYDGAQHNITDFLPDRCVTDLLRFLSSRFETPTEAVA